ncbi:hypothetical protein [Sphingomonas sp. PAMC 26621]|uniref:hypothetical protein n=1 Tax=Sphingomonas sp. PAMC 26621 TaxID=1112213 RepID=UPI0011112428|nr:hypothetical protein [Sphingomonas sp. PAMC 26621]
MTDVRSAFAAKLPTPPDRDDEAITRQAIIREAGLSVDDPETIANRHHPIPAGMDPVRLLKDYDTSRTTGRKVRCSACAHQQQHNRGFVAEMPDGRPALIGINCGERHFGDGEWARMHVDLRREQDTVYYEARVLPALNQITAAYDRAVALKGAIKSYEAAWRGLKTSLPALFKLLETACKNDGFMDRYVTRQIPTIGGDGKPTTKDQIDTVRFGKVPEPWAFGARSVVFDLDNAISTLRTSKLKFEGTADTKSRRAAFADLARGRRMVEDVAKQVRAYASH